MSKELLHIIEIPLYIRTYIRSNSMRAKFYEKGGKRQVPVALCDKEEYTKTQIRKPNNTTVSWKSFIITRKKKKTEVFYLVDNQGNRIIANEKHVGKQNIQNINGQDIYNGNCARHDRNNMLGTIKDMFKKYIKDLPILTRYPIRIEIYLFDTIIDDIFSNSQNWDLDNRFFPYGKGFADILKKEGKIVDDNIYYITECPHPIFVPVEEDYERKFVINIYKDNRPVILNHYLYKMKHGDNLK